MVFVGAINTYIEVKFDFLTSRLQCIFLEQQGVNNMSCSIGYSPEELCLSNLLESENSASNTSSVTVELSDFPYSQSNMYCYTITASNGTHTVNVKGLFNAGMYSWQPKI